jgi:hypothetical protein
MPKLPWFDETDDDGDPADWWKPEETRWESRFGDPDTAFNKEFTDTSVEKIGKQLEQFESLLAQNWRTMANLFHAAAKTPYEAFRDKITEPPALLVNAPELMLCADSRCGKHLRNKPAYLPDEKTIHITPNCARRMKRARVGFLYSDEPMPLFLDDCMSQSIHHQLNPQVFEPRTPFSLEDLEARTLIGCIERCARLAYSAVSPRKLPEIYKFETDCIRKYAKSLRKKPLSDVAGTVRSAYRADLFRHGFGRVYANDLYDLCETARIDEEVGMHFGDGGVGSPPDVMRVIVRAQDLTQAAELLFQRAEGPKEEYVSKKLWSRAQVMYGAVAYNLTILRNFLEKAASKQQA